MTALRFFVLAACVQLNLARMNSSSYGLAHIVSPLVEIALITLSPIPSTRKKRHLLSMIDPTMADLITPALMKKIHEYEVHAWCHTE